MSDKLNIYQRLREVMKQVAYIKKDKEVAGAGGGYMAITHDMVTAVVRPHFVAQGIVVVPRLLSGVVVDTTRKTKAGSPIIRYEGMYEVSFVNVDDPADVCTIPVAAHAEDQGDKAPGKALSYATKYGILKALLLESGENDESRVQPLEDEPEPLSPGEIDGLKAKLNRAKDKAELRTALKEAFGIAQKASDMDAHAAIKSYASTLAENLPDKVAA